VTEPLPPPLIVAVDHVAELAGLDPADEAVQFTVEAGIRAATVQAETYLHRPVTPLELTQTGVPPQPGGWPLQFTPNRVLSVTEEVDADDYPTGLFTVVYETGLDARGPQYGAIRDWVTAAAQEHPAVRRLVAVAGLRQVRSVSAEGQSVSYEPAPAAAQVPTVGVPPLSTLNYWRSADGMAWTRPGQERHRHRRHWSEW
jgi:hypothetical protein